MMSGRKWSILADKTLAFISIATEYGFCLDMLHEIRRRLYDESPFRLHHIKKEGTVHGIKRHH